MPTRCGLLALVATGLMVAGCGGPAGVAVVPVGGTIVRDGKPLTKVQVRFHPTGPAAPSTDDPAGVTRGAEVDDQGQFTLSTNTPGDGIPVGDYVVTVHPPNGADQEQSDGQPPKSQVEPTLKKFARVETSPLKVTIPPGGNSALRLEVK